MVSEIPQQVLTIFDDLAALNNQQRFKASSALVNGNFNENVLTYIINRLVTGLASARAAARIGFSSALIQVLQKFPKKWKLEDLWSIAEEKLSLSDKDQLQGYAIARYLLLDCVLASEAYNKHFQAVIEKQLALTARFPWLSMGIWNSIASASCKLSTKEFEEIYPIAKQMIPHSLENYGPEHLLAILCWSRKFGKQLQGIPFINKKGEVYFEDTTFPKLTAILKKANQSNTEPLIESLMEAARRSQQFNKLYRGVLEAWVLNTSEKSRTLERLFEVVQLVIRHGSLKDLLGIFSPVLLHKLAFITHGKATPEKSASIAKVKAFCQSILKFFEEQAAKMTKQDLSHISSVLLKEIDSIGPFDKIVGIRFTETLVSNLQNEELESFLQTASLSGGWSIRRLSAIFSSFDSETKKKALLTLVSSGITKTEDRFTTVANCIDSMFKVKVRAGDKVEIVLEEDNARLLKLLAQTLLDEEALKAGKMITKSCDNDLKKPVLNFWYCLRIWGALTPDAEEEKSYLENAEELCNISSNFGTDPEAFKVLLDLFIGLLSQLHRFHRVPVQYVFASVLPHLSTTHIMHIIETIALGDEDLVGQAENEDLGDDEDEDLMEKDNTNLENGQNGKHDSESELELSEESDEDPQEEIDPLLLCKLKQALGKAAVNESNAESDFSDGPDDEEMFGLDRALADAFRTIGGKNTKKKIRADASRIAQPLRIKLLELLLIVISSESVSAKIKLSIAVPLLGLAKTLLRRSDDTADKKVLELLNVLVHMKKLDVSGKSLRLALEHLTSESTGVSNPTIKKIIGDLSAWIFNLGFEKTSPDSKHVAAFTELMDKFMTGADVQYDSEVINGAYTRYPAPFWGELPKLLEYGFNKEIRPFRRAEAFLCAAAFLRRDIVKENPLDKKSIKNFVRKADESLKELKSSEADIKPRITSALLKVLSNLVSVLDEDLKTLVNDTLGETIDSLASDQALWKAGGHLKKLSASCQQINNKTPLPLLRSIQKNLGN